MTPDIHMFMVIATVCLVISTVLSLVRAGYRLNEYMEASNDGDGAAFGLSLHMLALNIAALAFLGTALSRV